MSPVVVALALFAAILHASWNAFLRSGADRLWSVTVMSFSSTAVALGMLSVYPIPDMPAWPFIGASAILQVGYSTFLVAAYRHGDLGQVYPIVRGTVPLLVTAGGLLLADERLAIHQLVGVGLVAVGIMSLSFGKARARLSSILFALATGAIIAAYATVDAIGVRLAGSSGSYTAWVLILYGALLPAAFIFSRGKLAIDLRSRENLEGSCRGCHRGSRLWRSCRGFPFRPRRTHHRAERDKRCFRGSDRLALSRRAFDFEASSRMCGCRCRSDLPELSRLAAAEVARCLRTGQRPMPRLRPKLQSIPPSPRTTPETW